MRKHNRRRGVAAAHVIALGCLLAGAGGTAAQTFVVPLAKEAPRIDGRIEPAEWASGAAFEGFGYDGKLQQRRARAYVAATADTIFVAVRSQLPSEGTLAAEVAADSLKAVYDDAIEVFVNPWPEAEKQVNYQMLSNSLDKGGYGVHTKGGAEENMAWQGNWKHASSRHDGWWDFECAIPVSSMPAAGAGRKTTDGLWRINLTRDWKNPWEWSSLSCEGGAFAFSGCVFRFAADAGPAVEVAAPTDPFVVPFEHLVRVRNPSAGPMEVAASLVLGRNNMPELRSEAALRLAPGEVKEVRLKAPADDPTTHYTLRALVQSADSKTVFYDRKTAWPKGKPFTWVAARKKGEIQPIQFNFAYYPYDDTMRIVADINGLAKDAKLTRLAATVRERQKKKEVKSIEFALDKFRNGRQEIMLELPHLRGEYEIALKGEGEKVPPREVVQPFERHVFPWEDTKLGISMKVYPPFRPIEVKGNVLKTVLREHTLGPLGLPEQITCTSAQTGVAKPILAAPVRLVVKAGGQDLPVKAGALQFADVKPHMARTGATYDAGGPGGRVSASWDYDGTARVDLVLLPTDGKTVDEVTMEVPLRADVATMIHANADRIRAPVAQKIPAGEGVVWDASKVACDDYIKNFCPYIYLGDAVRGLCWFAENDRGWSWDRSKPNLDVVRRGDQVILRVHFINKPTEMDRTRRITFGLLAAPVKPRFSPGGPNWWRYRYMRDKYALLGTDINWFGVGCGSVYPIDRDLDLWKILARGNKEKLSDAEVQATIDRGLKFFQPYGAAEVKTWEAHVRHNLRSHLGQKMIFYYNRATIQRAEEFETFKDEWALEDLRSSTKGNGIGEIKIVPSPSYIDYALYWYAKSFELGGNQGVYWDNFFIAPTFNMQMSDAYAEPDGTIIPAAGIWALRDLARRTFVMMNERGMPPITFPHMTSFNPLPMMAFATVQYDWEWKYSEGDVQDRFTRDQILLMSTGDLAGVWPVPLADQGKLQDDPWTQRTFAAVRLVHELDGYGGFGGWGKAAEANMKLAAPILRILDEPGLVVYRYWDDRPQPVVASSPDVPTIVYSVPGKKAVVAAVSYSSKDENVSLAVDAKALGFAGPLRASDGETGEAMALNAGKITLPLKRHDVRVLVLEPEGVR
jgi:hypothetical protein